MRSDDFGSKLFLAKKKKKFSIIFVSIILVAIGLITMFIVDRNTENQKIRIANFQKHFKENKFLKFVLEYLPLIIYNPLIILIMLIEYNKENIYKTFVLFNVYCLGNTISGILQCFFGGMKPFMYNDEILPYHCTLELGFSFTSSFIVASSAFYSALYLIETQFKKTYGIILKIILIIPLIFIEVLICILKYAEGNVFLGEIIFSVILGIGITILLIYGFNLQLDNPQEFMTILNHKVYINYVILIISIILYGLPIILRFNSNNTYNFKKCYNISSPTMYMFNTDNAYKQSLYGNICLIGYFLAMILSYIGIKLELKILFKGENENFLTYNFENFESYNDDYERMSSAESISITKDNKWNNTEICRTLIRLVIFIVIIGLILLLYYLISPWKNFIMALFLKYYLPNILISSMVFFIFKFVLSYTDIINRTFFLTTQN